MRRTVFIFALISMTAMGCAAELNAAELKIDDAMFQDPLIEMQKYRRVFSPQLKGLWLQAMQRPDAELRRLGADTVTLAVNRGMEGLADTADTLKSILESDEDPVVRRAAAQALVAIDARQLADTLARRSESDGLLMAQIVDPALARWSHRPSYDRWLAHLASNDAPRGLLVLSLECLGLAGEPRASAPSGTIASDANALPDVRLVAATALGRIHDSGLVDRANSLIDRRENPAYFGRLLAVRLLARHRDDESVELLKRLATESEPAVSVAALARLRAIGLELAMPYVDNAIGSGDAGMRRLGAELLVQSASLEDLRRLGPLLNDRNPGVRRFVAERMAEFGARPDLRPEVLNQVDAMLATNEWRGQEQACLIAGHLDHEPASDRLLQLLDSSRSEVASSTAWALRKLQVPDTYPALLQHARKLHENIRAMSGAAHVPQQLSQIFQLFGEARFLAAESLLREYVPRSMLEGRSRAAACWALGKFYEGDSENDLARQFGERFADIPPPPPGDSMQVRMMAAISIGRMKATSQLQILKDITAKNPASIAGLAGSWAIEQISGEKTTPIPEPEVSISNWFLTPIEGPLSPQE